MDGSGSAAAATLLLAAVTQEKQARADQHRAILALAQNYRAGGGTTISDETIDQLIEEISPRGTFATLPVSEFAGLELGALLGRSEHQANIMILETINLYYRHRPLWDAVQSLTLDAHRANKAAGKFGDLPSALVLRAGRMWVEKQHRYGWQGAIDLCDRIIIQLVPEIAAEKEAARLRAREVRIWELHEGTINLTAKLDPLDAKYVNATVGQIAGILHDKPEYSSVAIDILRAKALGIMAHPAVALSLLQGARQAPTPGTAEPGTGDLIDNDSGRINTDPQQCQGHTCGTITIPVTKLEPRVQVYLHLTATEDGNALTGAATIEGIGAVALNTLMEILDGKQVKVTPVIDLNTISAEHHYRPSRKLKEAVLLTFPSEAFPFSNRSSRGLDLDHTEAFWPASRDPQTRLGNLGPFGRRPHRAKTAGFWKCSQPLIGHIVWISPLGYRYAVDRDGTHRLE